ncbi:hypothetical protein FOA52_000390 [Chlamydomonas sp. UWO 241]|nr:hypothetical protein FOA52_000390 [Chlamydomonas sp. UWO 241]
MLNINRIRVTMSKHKPWCARISEEQLAADGDMVADLFERSMTKASRKKGYVGSGRVLTVRREALALYREILRYSNLFVWKDAQGRVWRDVLRANARKEYEDARYEPDPKLINKLIVTEYEDARLEPDPELINKLIITGRDAVARVVESFAKRRTAIIEDEAKRLERGGAPPPPPPPPHGGLPHRGPPRPGERRPVIAEVREWYAQNAEDAWGSVAPTWEETRCHAKCLRPVEQVKKYFQEYRARCKAEDVKKEETQEHQVVDSLIEQHNTLLSGAPRPSTSAGAGGAGGNTDPRSLSRTGSAAARLNRSRSSVGTHREGTPLGGGCSGSGRNCALTAAAAAAIAAVNDAIGAGQPDSGGGGPLLSGAAMQRPEASSSGATESERGGSDGGGDGGESSGAVAGGGSRASSQQGGAVKLERAHPRTVSGELLEPSGPGARQQHPQRSGSGHGYSLPSLGHPSTVVTGAVATGGHVPRARVPPLPHAAQQAFYAQRMARATGTGAAEYDDSEGSMGGGMDGGAALAGHGGGPRRSSGTGDAEPYGIVRTSAPPALLGGAGAQVQAQQRTWLPALRAFSYEGANQALAAHLAGALRGGAHLPTFANHSAPADPSGGLGGGMSAGQRLGARSVSAQLPVTSGQPHQRQHPQQQQQHLYPGLHHLHALVQQQQQLRSQGDDEAQQLEAQNLAQLLLASGLPLLQGPHGIGDEWGQAGHRSRGGSGNGGYDAKQQYGGGHRGGGSSGGGGVHPGSVTTGMVGALGRQSTWPWLMPQMGVQPAATTQQQAQQVQQGVGGSDGLSALLHSHSTRTSQQQQQQASLVGAHQLPMRRADSASAGTAACLDDDQHWRAAGAADAPCSDDAAAPTGQQQQGAPARFARHSAPSGFGAPPAAGVRAHSDAGAAIGWRPPLRPLDEVDEELGSAYRGGSATPRDGSGSGGGAGGRGAQLAVTTVPLPGPDGVMATGEAAGGMGDADRVDSADGAQDRTGGMDWAGPSPRVATDGRGGGAPPWLLMEEDAGLRGDFGGDA